MSRITVALVLFLVLPNLSAFSETRKEPALASVMSGCLFPGLGQFYNGETEKGIVYLGIETFAIGLMLFAAEDNVTFLGETIDVDDDDGKMVMGFMIWGASRLVSAIDAGVSADKLNKQKTVSVSPIEGKGKGED